MSSHAPGNGERKAVRIDCDDHFSEAYKDPLIGALHKLVAGRARS
jgi:hypothetical protein